MKYEIVRHVLAGQIFVLWFLLFAHFPYFYTLVLFIIIVFINNVN